MRWETCPVSFSPSRENILQVSSIPVALASAYIGNSVFSGLDYIPYLRTSGLTTGLFGRAAIAAVRATSSSLRLPPCQASVQES